DDVAAARRVRRARRFPRAAARAGRSAATPAAACQRPRARSHQRHQNRAPHVLTSSGYFLTGSTARASRQSRRAPAKLPRAALAFGPRTLSFCRVSRHGGASFESDVPARLDRLPWSRWHWRVVVALGITWMLDGLEVTLVGAIGPVLTQPATLNLTNTQLGGTASAYLAGAVVGALIFGRFTDLFGRKRLFLVTLAVYLLA